jgi:release factor glutamine methyltransferase
MSVTLHAILRAAALRLKNAGIDDCRHEARLLACTALARPMESVVAHADRLLSDAERRGIESLVERRAGREPLSRIRGEREFWGHAFRLAPATLDPRPDSETLVAAVLGEIADPMAPLRLLDLGTGCGCLLLALLGELPQATGIGVDRSRNAAAAAAANAASLGLGSRCRFVVGDWAQALAGTFDWIVCNPPYIPSAVIAGLAPEVARFDPPLALDGGIDGLDAYRVILPRLGLLLGAEGRLALEIGDGQSMAVTALAAESGLVMDRSIVDLGGRRRCLLFSPATVITLKNQEKKLLGQGSHPV